MKMRYSIEPINRRYVKSYGCLSFAKNMCKNISKYTLGSIIKNFLIVLRNLQQMQ